MKLRVVSDLHLEVCPIELEPRGEDILIVAGDTAPAAWSKRDSIDWLRQYARRANVPVLTIAGNHEFYGGHWFDTLDELRRRADHLDQLEPGAATFMERDVASYGGFTFIGATLWTDCKLFDHPYVRRLIRQGMNDYWLIAADWADSGGRITHDSFDYVIGDTRVVCNPRGYVDENRCFNPNLLIDPR